MPAPGELTLLPTITCFKCSTVDAYDVDGYRERRLAADHFRDLGWRWEREKGWGCPPCSGTRVEQAVMAEAEGPEEDWK